MSFGFYSGDIRIMLIGINALAAFKRPRTGVEEYTYQLIKHLAMLERSQEHRFVLYVSGLAQEHFFLPDNFRLQELKWPLPMWTQIRLAGEMFFRRPEVLFIPVHILPLIHPENSVVTIHGLEYEYFPEMYPRKHLEYLRWATKYAAKNAKKIIAVSENTKNDLIKFYGAEPGKIKVVHHGFARCSVFVRPGAKPSILFIGRLEAKKNVCGLIKAFKILKKKYRIPHQLILAGSAGCGYEKIKKEADKNIILAGYVPACEKWRLLKKADVFVLPSFYEGFGMPILEAQASGCPVITSNVSSMPEVAGKGAVLVNPANPEEISQQIYRLLNDQQLRAQVIEQGFRNLERFSWRKCAEETLEALLE